MHRTSEVLGSLKSAADKALIDDHFAVTSVSSLPFQASTSHASTSGLPIIREE